MADQTDADVAIEPEAAVEQQETLTQLFEQMRLQEAMEAMRRWDSVNPQISSSDSQLAASMLPALKRSRMPFVANFALAYQIDKNSLASFCSLLIETRVGSAVCFMECLKMKHLLPADVVLDYVIKQKDFRTGDMFVKGHRKNQHQFVQMLIDDNVQDKVIKKRLLQFKMKASAFPVYLERRQMATLRFLMYSKEYEQALQFVENSESLKLYACRLIVRHAGPEDPATKNFIFRAELAEQFPEIDTSAEEYKPLMKQDELAALGSCLSLVGAIAEANILFVDTLTALQTCADHLMIQPAIGFDSEWKAVHISTGPDGGPAKCALLQLASREKVFVVDVVALYEYGNILAPLFQSKSVIKLGFDTRGDVKALRPFLTGGYATDNVMSMLVDLQAVTRKLSTIEGTAVSNSRSIGDDDKDEDSKVRVSPAEQSVDISASHSKVTGSKTKKRIRKWKNKRSETNENGTSVKSFRSGLTAVAETYLGLPLDKRARMSDWERRPLTQAQLYYAALDAHVLVQIYYKMQEQHPVDTFEAVLKRCTQKRVK
ncbi:unnamed protein product [Peronospora destructor]|uniref:3'-5' exonuclease domain-containing protein n=1 Tax=Peronospora destructor TaxID=86335 RepID=A0AAV0T0U2_9STRA|nr:unnamed protein product [Peronospora destructor]